MIDRILKKINDKLNPPIVQFSPVRSGSTLVYNILRETFPRRRILKRHNIKNEIIKSYDVVVTYRNPLDSLASSFRYAELEVNESNIKNQIIGLKKNGLDDLLDCFDNNNILKLKYEDFYDQYHIIFDNIELFFNKNITLEERYRISKKYDKKEVIKLTKKFKDFKEYDKTTQLHGRHISPSHGRPNSYVEIFNEDQVKVIIESFKDYLIEFGYYELIMNNK